MSLADRHAHHLREAGVRFLFGVPGSGPSYELLDACERAGVPFVATAHEGAAVMMAGASTRVTGLPGAALAIKGPGVVNQVPGLGLALFEGYPVLSISEAFGAGSPPSAQHKRIPQDDVLAPLVKAVAYESEPEVVPRLLALATAEPAGPVHLALADGPAAPALTAGSSMPEDAEGREAVLGAVERARRPIMLLGSALVRQPRFRDAAPWLAQVPVFTTAAAKGVYNETDAAAAGVLTGAGGALAPESAILPEADLVIGLGLRTSELLGVRGLAGRVVIVDDVPRAHQVGLEPIASWRCPSAAALEAIAERMAARPWGLDLVAEAHSALRAHWRDTACLPPALFEVLNDAAATRPLRLVTDSGNFTVVAEHLWTARCAAAFTGSSNGRFMGAAIAQAIGIAMHDRSQPVVCTVGDGGLPPLLAEIKIAVQHQLPLLFVLMTDGHFGSMRTRIESRGWTSTGVRVFQPSWRRAVEGLGCPADAADSVAAFAAAVRAWDPLGGPRFLEVAMPPDPYARLLAKVRP